MNLLTRKQCGPGNFAGTIGGKRSNVIIAFADRDFFFFIA